MSEQVLSDDQIEAQVEKLHVEWSHIPGQGVVRVFETHNFAEGLHLVNAIGEVAERQNHHPEITLHDDQVEVTVFTQDIGGVTQEDLDLAKAIDDIVK